jgi:hypothetical protein
MSLMSSNDFCSQYKKRIQQAKERMTQKRLQEEQEIARQQEVRDARSLRKSRKRSLGNGVVEAGFAAEENPTRTG